MRHHVLPATALVLALLTTVLIAGCGSDDVSLEGEHDPTSVPADVTQLIDDWWEALERRDGSVLDLYLPEGHHLYGASRIDRDGIVDHLTSDSWSSEWITPPLVMANEGDGDYVVVSGIRNSLVNTDISVASAFAFEIETVPGGDLKIAQTAFIHRRGN